MIAFFDTNVVLDVLGTRQPFYADSSRCWALAERREVQGLVSAISLTNVYYLVRKWRSRREAIEMLRLIRDVFTIVTTDAVVVNRAIDSGFGDFEDAIQHFSAAGAGAACIVTRNGGDFRGAEVPVLSPAEFLAMRGE